MVANSEQARPNQSGTVAVRIGSGDSGATASSGRFAAAACASLVLLLGPSSSEGHARNSTAGVSVAGASSHQIRIRSRIVAGTRPQLSRRQAEVELDSDLTEWIARPENAGRQVKARAGVERAIALLRGLPPDVPSPEASIDDDGDSHLEWYFGPRRVFSVAVGATGSLNFASLVGAESVHGLAYLTRSGLPRIVRECLANVLG